jgi:ribosomal protein RSM22 (predicted rRNA methylase)
MVSLPQGNRVTNRHLQREIYQDFLNWATEEGYLFSNFNSVASCLEEFLCNHVFNNKGSCKLVAEKSYDVLGKCDSLGFNNVGEVYGYVSLHFLERYYRFQLIYLSMLEKGILPVRKLQANILDIGTGPAVALYSLNDIFYLLNLYGKMNDIPLLMNFNYHFDYVERSNGFRDFLHYFTEFINHKVSRNYAIPYHYGTFHEYNGLNLQREKNRLRLRLIDELMEDYDSADEGISRAYAQYVIDHEETEWKDRYRYNMIIFSNFLTSPSGINEIQAELISDFRSLRNGGTIVFVGGSFGKYSEIYDKLYNILRIRYCRLVLKKPKMSHNYDDEFSKTIRDFYKNVFDHLLDSGCDIYVPEKAKEHINGIINNVEGKGKSTWSLYVFQKRLNRHF